MVICFSGIARAQHKIMLTLTVNVKLPRDGQSDVRTPRMHRHTCRKTLLMDGNKFFQEKASEITDVRVCF